jgi:hypothetical protein
MTTKRSEYLFFRDFQGLQVVTDDAQLFFKLHDFPREINIELLPGDELWDGCQFNWPRKTTTTIRNHKSGRNMRVRTNNLRFALLGTLFSTLQISFQHDQFTSNLTVQQATNKRTHGTLTFMGLDC